MAGDLATAINTISVMSLLNLLEPCVIGYRNLAALCQTMNDDVAGKASKAKILRKRFKLLVEENGLVDSADFNNLPSPVRADLQEILLKQRNLFEEIDELVEKYGTPAETSERLPDGATLQVIPRPGLPDFVVHIAQSSSVSSTYPLPMPANMGIRIRDEKKFTLKQKFSWGWSDSNRMEALLGHLESLNNELMDLLSQKSRVLVDNAVPALVCPEIENASQLESISRIAGQIETPLAECLALMGSINQLDDPTTNLEEKAKKLELKHDAVRLDDYDNDSDARFCRGALMNEYVYVEFRDVDMNHSDHEKRVADQRLKRLAILLSSPLGHSFGALQTVGFFRQRSTHIRYGLVYRINRAASGIWQLQTLRSILLDWQNNSKTFTLNQRFILAKTLCTAIMHLHSARWLHRNMCTDSIVFEKTGSVDADLSRPKLLGFSLARPDSDTEMSLGREPSNTEHDLFLHPSLQSDTTQRFQRAHEYFALGVCLLCIGIWKPPDFVTSRFRDRATSSPRKWYRWLCKFAYANLGFSCGEIYRDVVMTCLTNSSSRNPPLDEDEDVEPISLSEFNHFVVSKLDSCSL